VRQRLVVFGCNATGSFTLEWDGATWVDRRPVTAPPTNGELGLTYDEANKRLTLYEVATCGSTFRESRLAASRFEEVAVFFDRRTSKGDASLEVNEVPSKDWAAVSRPASAIVISR
jgi:hypothetical protein